MLCSKCKKNAAVVFVSSSKDESNTKGYCISCAKHMGIKPLQNIIDSMGISEDELNNLEEQFSEILNSEDGNIELNDDGFIPGGAATFPFDKNFFSNMIFTNKSENNNSDNNDKTNDNNSQNKKKTKRKNLNLYCNNLTLKAKNGELDRVIGRDKEINRTIQILCRRTKNNPCLIGEPGVGKTAIAEGLAIKVSNGDVPFRLKNKEIYLLDLTSLVAGTQFRGQFESRIKGLIEEIKSEGNIILFIDEVHNLVGAGDSEGTMNAANILKPALSRGEIQVIGATTFAEYRKHIEKDSALERRFQPVKVLEPTILETVEVLNGVKDYYEKHHRVKISKALISRLVVLSERYIVDRFLPDKAIDLLDEACTYAALNNNNLSKYDKLIEEKEKEIHQEESLLAQGENVDYEKLADVRCKLAKLNEEIDKISSKALECQVTEEDVAKVIELWTGIPYSKICENEFKKLEGLERMLGQKVIGQNEAIDLLSAAIKRSRIQIGPRRRPASFIFVGPTGVGKTELVKVLADVLFDTPDALIRLDMSEYMEKHSVSKIVGSPPGYVGYDEAGQLTEKVRQRPYSIILLDEIEKAHPDVMNILLQVLDEGKITDSHGRVVNFENTVIVMTSNAGSNKKEGSLGFGKSDNELVKEKVMKALKEFLRPEFISRIDEIVVFNKLNYDDYKKIAALMLNEYVESIKEHGIKFSYDDAAIELLVKNSIDKECGARDLRNLIRKEVEDKLANAIINNSGLNINELVLTSNNDKLKLVDDENKDIV